MNQLSPFKTSSKTTSSPAVTNPLARALAETEQNLTRNQAAGASDNYDSSKLFSDALARTGGSFDPDLLNGQSGGGTGPNEMGMPGQVDPREQLRQQQEQERQLKLQRQRAELHRQINPVEMTSVFNARELKVKEEIDKLRHELKLLAKDVATFQKEVDITLMTEVAHPGQDGKYYINFFQKLRAFIMLLRQKIKSASTWATQMHSKKKKKKKGMMTGGQQHEKTSTVQDMMHHERSTQFSGG